MSQRGFTLIEIMVAVAVVTVIGVAVAKAVTSDRTNVRIQQARAEMQAIAKVASDYRKLRDNSSGYTDATGEDVAVLNSRFGVTLRRENPWGSPYTFSEGPVGTIVSTDVPVSVEPQGFKARDLGGGRTRLELQYIGHTSPQSVRRRYVKKAYYGEDSR